MPLPTLQSYQVRKDYATDFKTSSVKAKSSVQPFRYIKAFEFEDGKKQPLMMIGKLVPGVLEELKTRSGSGKVAASGLCRLVDNALQFEVEKGSLDDDDVALALKVANATALAKDSKVVATLTDGSSGKARNLDLAQVQNRFVKLQERVKPLAELGREAINPLLLKLQRISGELKALREGDTEAGAATVEELLDELEQAIVPLEKTFKDDIRKEGGPAADASVNTGARTEAPNVPDLEELAEAFSAIERAVAEAEQRISDYQGDPNGFLLLVKKVTSSDAALKAIKLRVDKATASPQKDALLRQLGVLKTRLTQLGEVAKEKGKEIVSWSKHIEERRQALGADIGKKKYIKQEGEIGADMEMLVGGLKRASINEVEFEPGQFSPYQKQGSTNDPTDDSPHQFDVFGITAEVVKKVMPLSAKKVYPWLKKVDDKVLWEKLKDMTAPATIYLGDKTEDGGVVDPVQIFNKYLVDAKFFAGLEHHFSKGLKGQEKPTIVPLDISGMKLWPALLTHVQSEIDTRFPKQKHLILWRD